MSESQIQTGGVEMRKKSVLLASVSLAVLVGLVGVVVVWAQSGAEENPPHTVARALTEEELAAGEEMEVQYFDSYEEAMEFIGADPADFQPPAAGDADDQETIRQAIQTLVAQWSGTVLQGSGWLHMVTHHMRDKDRVSSLPNGEAIPLNYISETWYHLNDQGQAVEVIAFMCSEDGEPVQISTFRGNIWRNLTVGEKWGGEPFTPRLDLGFSADAAQAHEWGSTLSQQMVTLAGRTALRFTMRDEFGSPLLMEGYAQPVISAERRAYFDTRSGALLLLERVLVAADGKERVVERAEPITIEYGVETPAEVLAFLQQEVTK
jgi:hypothetical protein